MYDKFFYKPVHIFTDIHSYPSADDGNIPSRTIGKLALFGPDKSLGVSFWKWIIRKLSKREHTVVSMPDLPRKTEHRMSSPQHSK